MTPLLMVGTDAERKRLDGRRMKREEEERGAEATEGKKICEGSRSLGGALPELFRCCALESPTAEEKQGGFPFGESRSPSSVGIDQVRKL